MNVSIPTLLIASLLMTLVSTFLAIYSLRPLAEKYGLLDIPDHRKHHTDNIPLIGGIAIFIGVLIGTIVSQKLTIDYSIYLVCAGFIVLLGIFDDAKNLPAIFRAVIQTVIAIAMTFATGIYLHSFGDLLGFGTIDLGLLGYLITAFAVVGAINAFNMLDGIDGLVGINAIISFAAMAILFSSSGQEYELLLAVIFIAALLPYLAFNLRFAFIKKKIFMGDAGSMLIGLTVVWLLMQGTQSSDTQSFRPVTALWIIAIPLIDMVAIMIRRTRQGRSPLSADRDHLHHILMNAGFSSSQTLVIISILSAIFATIGLSGEWFNIPDNIMFFSFILLFVAYHYFLQSKSHYIKKLYKQFIKAP